MVDLEGLVVCTSLVGTIFVVGYMNRIISNHRLRKIIEDRENDLDYIKAITINRGDDNDFILKLKRKQYPVPDKAPGVISFTSRDLKKQYFDTIEKIHSILYSNTLIK